MAFNSLDSVDRPQLSNSIEAASLPFAKKGLPKWIFGLSTLLLITGGGYLAYRQFMPQPQAAKQRMATVPVERTNLSVTVSANGTVEPEKVINVSPKNAGIMTSLLVKEGDALSQGQIIARMDDSNLQGQFTQAQAQLAAAKANLEKLLAGNRSQETAQTQARLNSAQANLTQAQDDLRRNQELFEAGAVSRQAYNKASTARDTAQAQMLEAQQALSLSQAGSRPEDIAAARAQLEAAKGVLQTVQAQINDTVIRSPFSGVVSRKYADPGAFVTPMTAGSSVSSATSSSILSLASTNRVVANVAESSIAKIRVGQSVVIKADAYPGKTFQGRVTQIATDATVEQNVTSFEVKIALLAEAQRLLRSGMNVSVQFQVSQLQRVITVPTVAITRQQNVTGVFVAGADQHPKFIPIVTGATVNNRTEVKTGLKGNEKVLMTLPPKPQSQSGLSLPGLPGSTATEGPPAGGPPGGPPPR